MTKSKGQKLASSPASPSVTRPDGGWVLMGVSNAWLQIYRCGHLFYGEAGMEAVASATLSTGIDTTTQVKFSPPSATSTSPVI